MLGAATAHCVVVVLIRRVTLTSLLSPKRKAESANTLDSRLSHACRFPVNPTIFPDSHQTTEFMRQRLRPETHTFNDTGQVGRAEAAEFVPAVASKNEVFSAAQMVFPEDTGQSICMRARERHVEAAWKKDVP